MFLRSFCQEVQNKKGYAISCIKSDHGRVFENHAFEIFAMSLALNINSHHQGPLNKIELMREA